MPSKEPKVAVYTGTRNIYDAMWGAAKSMLAVGCVDEVYLLIEDDEFPYDTGSLPVYSRNVSTQRYFDHDGPNMQSEYTYMAMMRAALAFEFPWLKRILSLDCDTYALKDCREIWNADLDANGGYYFAAAYEPERCKPGKDSLKYCNIGVCLYNLDMLRNTGKAVEVIRALNRRRFTWLDQDAMSFLCQGWILELPPIYNSCLPFVLPHDPKQSTIRHFAGKKREKYKLDPIAKKWDGMPLEDVIALREANYGKS